MNNIIPIIVISFMIGFLGGTIVEHALEEDYACPPMIEASTKLRLYFDEIPPEPTELDNEFAELCGVGGWSNPVKETPPEEGGA